MEFLVLLLVLIVVVPLITWAVIYNQFIKYKNKVAESLSLVDVQLKLRFDLVPNLVEVVKGYAKHESETLQKIVELRNKANSAIDEKEKIELSNELVSEMRNMFVIVEAYPQLKANEVYLKLMNELSEVEDRISASRRFYNSNVNAFNNLTETFPSNLIAKMYGFKKQDLFRVDTAEKLLPKVEL